MPKLNKLSVFVLTVVAILFNSLSCAEITTTKIAAKEERVSDELYDGSKNFLGKDIYKYIGQELYLPGKSESLRKYGYDNFCIDYTKSTIGNKANVYKCCDGFNSKYTELAGKYFKVISVKKNPIASETILGDYFLELKEKETGDRSYFKYKSQYEDGTFFPFIVVEFFEKQKKMLVGQNYVFANKLLDGATDIETGKPITNTPSQKWKCIDLTIEEKFFKLAMVIKNPLGEKVTVSHETVFNKYRKGDAYKFADAETYKRKFGESNWLEILDGKVAIGFTEEMVLLSWGKPEKINRASYGDQWVYEGSYLYFENGKVKAFN